MEEQEGAVNFKFGVLYAKAGQKTDDEMFSNGENTLYMVTIICNSHTLFLLLLLMVLCYFNFLRIKQH